MKTTSIGMKGRTRYRCKRIVTLLFISITASMIISACNEIKRTQDSFSDTVYDGEIVVNEEAVGARAKADMADKIPEALDESGRLVNRDEAAKAISRVSPNLLQHGVDGIGNDRVDGNDNKDADPGRSQAKVPLATEGPHELTSGVDKKDKPIISEERVVEKKVWLDIRDADIRDLLLRLLPAYNRGVNLIFSGEVKGKVSMRLHGVPWNQALDLILGSVELGMERDGNVIHIAPLDKIRAKAKIEPLVTRLISLNYADAAKMEEKARNILSDRGTISVDERTNTLIVRDIKANTSEMADLAARLDTQTPQVLIEARIVEAQNSFARDLGIQWGIAHRTSNRDRFNSLFGGTSTSPSSTITPNGFIASGGQFESQPNFAVNLPASGDAGILGSLGFSFGKLTGDPLLLDLRLTAGESAGLTKTISRPRIATLDNKEASIKQGEEIPYPNTSSTTGTSTEFKNAELELSVTPHVTPDGKVLMKIRAKRNSVGQFRGSSTVPAINTKEVSTEVLVADGETTVIGGIIVSEKTNSNTGIPFLKDIPVIGWLFKGSSRKDDKTELLIFITPKILHAKGNG